MTKADEDSHSHGRLRDWGPLPLWSLTPTSLWQPWWALHVTSCACVCVCGGVDGEGSG